MKTIKKAISPQKTPQFEMARLFKQKNLSLSTAESCTGGLISKMLTDMPGSSQYFKGGLTAYSNEAKKSILGVDDKTLSSFGAVSKECAIEMAERAKKIFKTDFAVSTTGVAGPGGATDKKPVGLVYFALAAPDKTTAYKKVFEGDRKHIRICAAKFALDIIWKNIK